MMDFKGDLGLLVLDYVRLSAYRVLSVAIPPLKSLTSADPDLVSVLLLVLILYISLLILSHTTRMLYSFVVTMIRLALVVAMAAVAFWMYQRGIDGFVADVTNYVSSIDWRGAGASRIRNAHSAAWSLFSI
jgi:glucan phosphoethanolaminetransferase (alkaline phosphatase superfamily)